MLDPGGTLAVASRQDNIASTATVFCLMGCSWPQALSLAHTCFDAVDQEGLIDTTPSPLINGAGQLLQEPAPAGRHRSCDQQRHPFRH